MVNSKDLSDVAQLLRRDVIEMTSAAGSGHLTSCFSAAEIFSTLFFNEMSYDLQNPYNPDNDEFILSKGHAAPIYYASLKRAGCINEYLPDLRKINSPLEGHPMPRSIPNIKVATGSLGQGLSIGAGMALAIKKQGRQSKVYVLMGDSECAEGSVWEAVGLSSYYNLNNLCAIVDVNRLGQRGETMLGYDLDSYKKRFTSFGWDVITLDGHDVNKLLSAYTKFRKSKKPFVILAKTIKGKGLKGIENKEGWHGKALTNYDRHISGYVSPMKSALENLPNPEIPHIEIKLPRPKSIRMPPFVQPSPLSYHLGAGISTREAYGDALSALALVNPHLFVLDAEVSNSTFADKAKKSRPDQFIECFIAEQNMIGMALGLSKKSNTVFASSFAAFLTRAHDQLRMAALSLPKMVICGSHCGVSIGEDGASQMGLEDIAMFRTLPESIVLYPSDAVSAEKLVFEAALQNSLVYIRTTRVPTTVVYKNEDKFPIGDFKVVHHSRDSKAVLVGAGITLQESIKAHDQLKEQSVSTSVVDCYCIKPFPADKFVQFIKENGSTLIVSEDHYAEGGIGEMLSSICANHNIKVKTLAVNKIPHSGRTEELLDLYEIDAKAIVKSTLVVLNE